MSWTAYFAFAAPVTAFLLHVLATQTLYRSRPPVSRQKAAAWICVANVGLWIVGSLIVFGLRPETFFFTLTSASFSLTYFLVWNCTITARRVRVLVGMHTKEKQPVQIYSPSLMIEQRVHRLEAMGAIRREGTKLFAVPGILLGAALFFRNWRRFFRCDQLDRFHARGPKA